jgi:hypothetical protein
MNELVEPVSVIPLQMQHMRELLKKPFRALPEELREEALILWGMVSNKMPSGLPISIAFARWIGSFGLTIEDAREILRGAQSPKNVSSYVYSDDLIRHLAGQVHEAIRRREQMQEAEKRSRIESDLVPPDVSLLETFRKKVAAAYESN